MDTKIFRPRYIVALLLCLLFTGCISLPKLQTALPTSDPSSAPVQSEPVQSEPAPATPDVEQEMGQTSLAESSTPSASSSPAPISGIVIEKPVPDQSSSLQQKPKVQDKSASSQAVQEKPESFAAPKIKEATLKTGTPQGYSAEEGDSDAPITVHIEVLIENPQYQNYDFILVAEDLGEQFVLKTYKTINRTATLEQDQITVSHPILLSDAMIEELKDNPQCSFSLSVAGIDDNQMHGSPSEPLYLEMDVGEFIPKIEEITDRIENE